MDGESNQVKQGFRGSLEAISNTEVIARITCEERMTKIQLAAMLISLADQILKKEAGITDPTTNK